MVNKKQKIESALKQGVEHHSLGNLDAALRSYENVLAIDSNQADALHLLGVIHAQSKRPNDAISLINRAIQERPGFSEALFNLGRIYQAQNKPQDAINTFVRAARFQEGYTKAWLSLAIVYADVGMYEEALSALEAGLISAPDSEALHDAVCRAYKYQGSFDKCITAADRGLSKQPSSARLWINRSEACFASGQLEDGWRAYRWRLRHPDNVNLPRHYKLPQWEGEELQGKTILIITEQGPGETFMFASMLPEVIRDAKKCIVVTSARLMPILQRSFPEIDILDELTTTEPPHNVDYQISLVDLGQWLRPTWDSFPEQDRHIIADPERVALYRDRYKKHCRGNLIVGIAWRTRGVDMAEAKSLPLEAWKPFFCTPGVTFVSLQYGDTRQEIEDFRSSHDFEILCESGLDPLTDLEGHLAQIGAMDLVISTSNTAAHAAGSMGITTWCLLSEKLGDGLRWQWFYELDRSPWYNRTHLYRQVRRNDWSEPVANATIDLVKYRASQDHTFNACEHLLQLSLDHWRSGQINAMGLFANEAILEGSKSAAAYQNVAKWLCLREEPGDALKTIDYAINNHGLAKDSGLRLERAACLMQLDRFEEATKDLLVAFDEMKVDTSYWLQLCQTYRLAGHSSDAMNAVDAALELSPNNNKASYLKARLLIDCGQMEAAVKILDAMVAANPSNVEASSVRSVAHLGAGNFRKGWPEYQNRLRRSSSSISYARFPHPVWQGEKLDGARVLVWTEQGIGEEILLSTIMPDLIQQARSVTLLCSKRMVPLLERSFPGVTVEERLEPLCRAAVSPEIDFQMSLSDLGTAFRPNIESFTQCPPRATLKADIALTQGFRHQYRSRAGDRPLVGLSWHSSSPDLGPLKSLPIHLAAKLIEKSNAFFVSVQASPDPEDIKRLSAAGGKYFIHDPDVEATESMDIAMAQMAALDYVITVSNTSAHMAGALSIPTALLVPPKTGRHWYWLRGSETSPWYNSVHLIETKEGSKWADVIEKLAHKIRNIRVTQ
ncbi:MAG: tetratricopeptide repeat protein [Rhodospirillaceae bacterium]